MAPAQGWHAQIEKCKHLYIYICREREREICVLLLLVVVVVWIIRRLHGRPGRRGQVPGGDPSLQITCVCTYIYIYIYIYRERERDYVCTYIYIYIYAYIHIHNISIDIMSFHCLFVTPLSSQDLEAKLHSRGTTCLTLLV